MIHSKNLATSINPVNRLLNDMYPSSKRPSFHHSPANRGCPVLSVVHSEPFLLHWPEVREDLHDLLAINLSLWPSTVPDIKYLFDMH